MLDAAELAKINGVLAEVPDEIASLSEENSMPIFNGKKVLIPVSKQLRAQTYYNKIMFAEAGITEVPQTWEQFIEACDKLAAKGYTPLIIAGEKDIWATSFGYWVNVINPEIMDAIMNIQIKLVQR